MYTVKEMHLRVILLFVCIGLLLTCVNSDKDEDDRIDVVVTIPILGDFARQVGGDKISIFNLLYSGSSPHTFEPKPSQARDAAQADLAIKIGRNLDDWVDNLLPEDTPIITATSLKGIELITEGENYHEDQDHGANPHIWLDPLYAKLIVNAVARELTRIDPENKNFYETNKRIYLAKLDSLHHHITQTIERFPKKQYISFHPAWVYFARRYNLIQAAVIVGSPGKEPTPRHLEEVIRTVKESGVGVVFAEPQLSPRLAETIARESKARVVILDPLGGRDETYIDLMLRNLSILKKVLDGNE